MVCQHDERNLATAFISGKRKEVRTGKKLKDKSTYPLQLTIPQYKVKLGMDLSAKNDIFMLSVNMMSYIKLPYKYNLISEDDKNIEFDATIALN